MINFRSNCALARTLDIMGDKWTLLVLREVVAFRHLTFKEISQMTEGISTNILSDRLKKLCALDFLEKKVSQQSKLVYNYFPTPKAMELGQSLSALMDWSDKYLFEDGQEPKPRYLIPN